MSDDKRVVDHYLEGLLNLLTTEDEKDPMLILTNWVRDFMHDSESGPIIALVLDDLYREDNFEGIDQVLTSLTSGNPNWVKGCLVNEEVSDVITTLYSTYLETDKSDLRKKVVDILAKMPIEVVRKMRDNMAEDNDIDDVVIAMFEKLLLSR